MPTKRWDARSPTAPPTLRRRLAGLRVSERNRSSDRPGRFDGEDELSGPRPTRPACWKGSEPRAAGTEHLRVPRRLATSMRFLRGSRGEVRRSVPRGRGRGWCADECTFGCAQSAASSPASGMRVTAEGGWEQLEPLAPTFRGVELGRDAALRSRVRLAGDRAPSGETDRRSGLLRVTAGAAGTFRGHGQRGRGAPSGAPEPKRSIPTHSLRGTAIGRKRKRGSLRAAERTATGERRTFGYAASIGCSEPDEAETLRLPLPALGSGGTDRGGTAR
jgi:hypothetical protein